MMQEQEAMNTAKPNTFIGKGSEFVGKLTFEGTVRIDGKIDGEIFSKGTLIIGPEAEVAAKINVDTVFLSGLVRGNINAGKKIVMKAPGRLYGNIKSPTLVIEEGVIFEGQCKMESSGAAGEPVGTGSFKMTPPPSASTRESVPNDAKKE
jgi:cytoskeletal protein CcmA (bactofilin family)